MINIGETVMSKTKITNRIVTVICLLCVIHFSISIFVWFLFIWYRLEELNRMQLIGLTLAMILFIASIVSLVMVCKKKTIGKIIILLTILLATAVFFYETSNHLCQVRRPISHIGNKYFNFSVGFKEDYCTWWWYHRSYNYFDLQKNENNDPNK